MQHNAHEEYSNLKSVCEIQRTGYYFYFISHVFRTNKKVLKGNKMLILVGGKENYR